MSSLYDLALTVPWLCTDEALQAMLAIAAREPVSADDLKPIFHGPKSLALRDGQRRDDSERTTVQQGVALIPIDGPIFRYADYFTRLSGGVTTESLAKDFQKALDDPAVSSILLVIDSPGGEATGINELADAIYAARGQKPIGAYIEGYGASAAYWIASAADWVTVDDEALVGSIGTVMGVPDPARRMSRTIDFVSSQSPKKRVDPTADDGRAYLQGLVDDMTEVFIEKVMRNRKMTRQQVLAAEGGLRIGKKAVDAGLADSLGSEAQAIQTLAAESAARRYPSFPGRLPGSQPIRMEAPHMDWKAFWSGLLGAQAEAEGQPLAAQTEVLVAPSIMQAPTTTTTAPQAQPDPLTDRVAELEAQLAETRRQQIAVAATTFADDAIRQRRAMPAERGALIALYTQMATDDDRDGGARITGLEQLIAQRAPHHLTAELVQVGPGGELVQSGTPQPMTEARREQLLRATPSGQAVLDKRRRSRA